MSIASATSKTVARDVASRITIKTGDKVTRQQADLVAKKLDSYLGSGITKLKVERVGPQKYEFKGQRGLEGGIQKFKGIINVFKDHLNKLETSFKRGADEAGKAAKHDAKAGRMFVPAGDLNHEGGVIIGSDFST